MNFNKFCLGIVVCALVVTANSCGDDGPDATDNSNSSVVGPNTPVQDNTVYSPEDSKEHLENVASEALNLLKPEDQQEVISLATYFTEEYGDLDMPDVWARMGDDEYDRNEYSPTKFMRDIAKGLKCADPMMITRAVETFNYNVNFPLFTGVFRPGRYEWEKVGDSNDVVFQFTSKSGAQCELKVTASAATNSIQFETRDEEYDYYYNEYYTDIYKYDIQLPKTFNVTLTQGSTKLVDGVVNSVVDLKGHNANASCDVKVANLHVVSSTNATDSRITTAANLYVGSTLLMNCNGVVNGRNLCNMDVLTDDPDPEDILTDGTANVDILGKLQVDAKTTFNKSVFEALDNSYIGDYDGYTQSEASKVMESYINTLNKNFITNIRYNNTTANQASIRYKSDFWSYPGYYGNNYWEYSIIPVIVFNDGTPYEFEDYFESGFGNVVSLFDTLVLSYERAFNR